MRRAVTFIVLASFAAACSSSDSTALRPVTTFQATLTAAGEVPPVTTPAAALSATGVFNATLDGKILTYNLSTSGLSGSGATAGGRQAHIHGPAAAGANASVLVNFAAAPPGSASAMTLGSAANAVGRLDLNNDILDGTGTLVITAADFLTALNAGTLYVNVHTAANPGGEIRGQLLKK
jgi:hypothetical protein